ncbi:hypothetical protein [Nocardia heshunensis]
MAEDVAPEAKEPTPVAPPEDDAANSQIGEIGANPLVGRSQGLSSFDDDVNVDFSYSPSWGYSARKAEEPEA